MVKGKYTNAKRIKRVKDISNALWWLDEHGSASDNDYNKNRITSEACYIRNRIMDDATLAIKRVLTRRGTARGGRYKEGPHPDRDRTVLLEVCRVLRVLLDDMDLSDEEDIHDDESDYGSGNDDDDPEEDDESEKDDETTDNK